MTDTLLPATPAVDAYAPTEPSSSPWDVINNVPQIPDANTPTAADPYASQPVDPYSVTDTGPSADTWLDAATPSSAELAGHHAPGVDWLHPFNEHTTVPLADWVNQGLDYVVQHARPAFQAIRLPIESTLAGVENALQAVPPLLMLALLGLIAWQAAGRRLALGTVFAFTLIGLIGAWSEAMTTLSLALTSVCFCLLLGLPMGIAIARSERLDRWLRPLLDAMQTTPAFVYLVPVVMLFGIGNVPGVVVTIVFALPPLIRLTNLGIRQVRPDLIEASRAFGASPWQMLSKVQLPLALPTIMAGVNQTLMLSLSMVVIASMIAVGGLGQMVLRGIGRLDMGLATVGGLGIVLMAIVLDRVTQAMGRGRQNGQYQPWHAAGPIGLARRLLARRSTGTSANSSDQAATPLTAP
ncbi:ABC transporter permease [Chitinimonas naiadis]